MFGWFADDSTIVGRPELEVQRKPCIIWVRFVHGLGREFHFSKHFEYKLNLQFKLLQAFKYELRPTGNSNAVLPDRVTISFNLCVHSGDTDI